jgi:hypothetical protein
MVEFEHLSLRGLLCMSVTINLQNTRVHADRWLQAFKEVDWLVPAWQSVGYLDLLARAIDSAPPGGKLDVMRLALSATYTPDRLARMFLDRYCKIMHVRDFSRQIDESFKAHFLGMKHVAITGLVPVIEGIVRKMALRQHRDVGKGTRKLVAELDHLVEREKNSPHRYEERLAMLEGLRDFIRDRFLESTDAYAGLDQLNRHGILHGIFDQYGDVNNFYRLVTILDLLCFSVGLIEGGVSCFAPEATPEAAKLAAHYKGLMAAAPMVQGRH